MKSPLRTIGKKGWNKEGIPIKESLHELGLDYVSEDFVKRGVLTDGEDIPSGEISSKTAQE
jgi:hypothetical protein